MTQRADISWHFVASSGEDAEGGLSNIALRPFGILPEDREVDFDRPRPTVETQILYCCTRDSKGNALAEDRLWAMEVSQRIQWLLAIAALGASDEYLTIELRCQNHDCGEDMEIDLSLRDIVNLQPRGSDERLVHVGIGSESFSFHRPTGKDQLTWLNDTFADEPAAVAATARTLVVDADAERFGRLAGQGTEWVRPVSDALEAADPLVSFSARTPCPCCGAEDTHYLDLGALALQRLRRAQDRLLEAIHTLASRYHWSEDQILALPPWRRARYLTFTERDAAR